MSISADTYESIGRAATYLTAEWSDFLNIPSSDHTSWVRRMFGEYPTLNFYRQVKSLSLPYLTGGNVLDIGSATGRMLYELASSPKVQFDSLTGCEISTQFSEYAQTILLGKFRKTKLPVLCNSSYKVSYQEIGENTFRKVQEECTKTSLKVINADDEELTQRSFFYDAIYCLNVIDRHRSPQKLASNIRRLLSPGGVICVACSFDWDLSPANKDERCDDLVELFRPDQWRKISEKEIDYIIVGGGRQSYVYRAQVALFKPNV